jgi:hypothetical protein
VDGPVGKNNLFFHRPTPKRNRVTAVTDSCLVELWDQASQLKKRRMMAQGDLHSQNKQRRMMHRRRAASPAPDSAKMPELLVLLQRN